MSQLYRILSYFLILYNYNQLPENNQLSVNSHFYTSDVPSGHRRVEDNVVTNLLFVDTCGFIQRHLLLYSKNKPQVCMKLGRLLNVCNQFGYSLEIQTFSGNGDHGP